MASPASTPALAPPPGDVYSPDEPNLLWKWNVLCQVACLLFPSILFILRTYIRIWIKRIWTLEDYLSCFAFMGLLTYSGLLTTIVQNGGGTHEWELTKPKVTTILYYVNLTQIVYGPAAAFTKLAILTLYLRIFSPLRWSRLNITIRLFMLVICLFYFALTIVKICQCVPRARIWDRTVPGKCVSLVVVLEISGLFNITSDVAILLIPLKGIWNLQLSKKRKIAVYAVFTVGAIAPAFSIVGFVERVALGSSPDKSYNQVVILLWATAELAVGVMVICFPTIPGLLHSRTKRPTPSVVNGSARQNGPKIYLQQRPMSADECDVLVEREYIELHKGPFCQARMNIPPNSTINEISCDNDMGNDKIRSSPVICAPADGILRTIEIEQSNTEHFL